MTAVMPDRTWTEETAGGHLETHDGDFAVDAARRGPVEEVWVRGELDMATAPLLRGVLDGLYGRRPERLEVDLSGLSYLDTHGLNTLVAARRRMAGRGARLALSSVK